ncbi:MAG: tetratricopeptide repeat protein, partial [Wenzhouxiangella sp.]
PERPVETEPPKPARRESDPAITIERADEAAEERGDDDLTAARRALARGRHELAERRLDRILASEPGHDEGRMLLADILLRQGEAARAARILDQGLEHSRQPAQLAARLGRILIEHDQTARAIEVLTDHAPPTATDPDYHQLLAAAHRQAGDHEAALATFRALSEVVPGRGAIWVGLGASLEALERHDEAIAAYRRALDADDPRAARFADQRLDALNPDHGASR